MKMANFLERDITDLLPIDTWKEIMRVLPIRSIMRCRCVCKSFRLLIEECEFVAKLEAFRDKILLAKRLSVEFMEVDILVVNNKFCRGLHESWYEWEEVIPDGSWFLHCGTAKCLESEVWDIRFEDFVKNDYDFIPLKTLIENRKILISQIKELEILVDERAKDLKIESLNDDQEIHRLKQKLCDGIRLMNDW